MTGARSLELDAFVDEARGVGIVEAFERCGYSVSSLRRASFEYVGPCPSCGGKDRFSLNPQKNVFNCRKATGGDGIALAQHLTGEDFLDACELLTGRERPGAAVEDERDRAKRRRDAEARLAEQRRQAAEAQARADADQNHWREREWSRCLEIWRESAGEVEVGGRGALAYLDARGLDGDRIDPLYLRTHPRLGFFAKPDSGPPIAIHHGLAMVALFVRPFEGKWQPIGIHQTWIDLAAAPKFRPSLHDPVTSETLPTKKMRGSKAGGLIPLIGRLSRASRMVAGDGIETVLGFARFDGFRPDTFYCAAGDLGNLCGKALTESRFRHPTLRKTDKAGRSKPVMVPGSDPDMTSLCLPVPAAIDELVLLGDGDSEPIMTRAALKRGIARHAREGRTCRSLTAPLGQDWADVANEMEAA